MTSQIFIAATVILIALTPLLFKVGETVGRRISTSSQPTMEASNHD